MEKIEKPEIFEESLEHNLIMKPIYGINEELNCGTIKYNDKTYLVDLKDKDRIINHHKKFIIENVEKDIYPFYNLNYKKITYLEFLFGIRTETTHIYFKNNNIYDLRRCNIDICHYFHDFMIKNYNILQYIDGHSQQFGQDAGIVKNPLWKIEDKGKEILMMYCEKNTLVKLCPISYQKILEFEKTSNEGKKLTWYKNNNGYVVTHLKNQKLIYIHQIIMNCYGNGKGTKLISVDHIDQNPLNNCYENLRIATRKQQEENTTGIKAGTKRERNFNAKTLPDEISQDMMKKYVVYYHEWLNSEHTKSREYFKVESPKLEKPWISSKSGKVSIIEKLNEANKVAEDLENNIYPVNTEPTLPKYIFLNTIRDKLHLIFERRTPDKRYNIKMVLPNEYDLKTQLDLFMDKIKVKYPEYEFNDYNNL